MNQEHISPPSPIIKALLPHTKKSRATLFAKVTRLPVRHPGNPAIRLRRTRGFPSPSHKGFGFVVELIVF
jgi:hypothetical protein